ncbi:MAG: DUF6789 family protein [Candidatus Heimdallarchaeota archaeon]
MDILFLIFNGFIIGILATGIMSIGNILVWRKWGFQGVLEWDESKGMIEKLLRRPIQETNILVYLLHFFNGGLLAVPFLVLVSWLKMENILVVVGVIYALIVWLVTLAPVHKWLTGNNLFSYPKFVYISIGNHLLYGLILGIFVDLSLW